MQSAKGKIQQNLLSYNITTVQLYSAEIYYIYLDVLWISMALQRYDIFEHSDERYDKKSAIITFAFEGGGRSAYIIVRDITHRINRC